MADNEKAQDAVMIERSLDAPIDLVWRLWTDAGHFKVWYGPDGAVISVAKMEVRVGGARLVCMEMATPNGAMQMWLAGEHREVIENKRLVYTETMTDEHGNPPAPPGMPDLQPVMTEVRVELEAVGDRTGMVVTHVGIPVDSPGEGGWVMAFDKLDVYAAAVSGRSW